MLNKKSGTPGILFLVFAVLFWSTGAVAQNVQKPDADVLLKEALKESRSGNYDSAITLSRQGLQVSPGYIDIELLLGRLYILKGANRDAIDQYNNILLKHPDHTEASLGKARAFEAEKQYEEALQIYKHLSLKYPGDSTYLLKQLGVLELQHRFNAGVPVSDRLLQLYPSNTRFKDLNIYFETAAAALYLKNGTQDSAQYRYQSILLKDAGNKEALLGMAKIYEQQQSYADALSYYDRYYADQQKDSSFLVKKANLLEARGKYKEAANTSDLLVKEYPENVGLKKFNAYKQSLVKKHNQVGLLYLQSFFNNDINPASVISAQYLRRFDQFRSSIIGRINYASRQGGQGVQFELESYLYHNKKHYSFLGAGISNKIAFPGFKAAYSLYSGLNKGWELETGIRYISADTNRLYFGVLGLSKETDKNWFNLRNYIIYDEPDWHHTHIFTWRRFLNEKRDYATLILGLGTSPDDRSRNYSTDNFNNFLTKSVGLGYQKNFRNSSFSLTTVWNNQKLASGRYLNQYDCYITFFHDF